MKSFEYASPRTEAEALGLLNEHGSTATDTAVLAGGTDLVPLMQRDLVAPRLRGKRVVEGIRNVSRIDPKWSEPRYFLRKSDRLSIERPGAAGAIASRT